MNASDLACAVAKALHAAGSKIVFGLPGGGNNLELVGAAEAAGLRFVLAHGETAATIMAATYGDLTGRPTACVVTRGPGAASAVNGTAQAMLDRQSLLMLTDTVSAADRARTAHQQLNQPSLFAAVAKWSAVLGQDDPAATMAKALAVTAGPAPGPVHLEFDPTATGGTRTPPPAAPTPSAEADVERALALIAGSRRPVVVLGVGARSAVPQLRAVLKGTDVPVLTTYRAKGIVPDSWDNAAGLFTGATVEAPVLRAADLIVFVGLDTVELIPNAWPYPAPVVSFAAWQDTASYVVPAVEAIGDLPRLVERLQGQLSTDWPAGWGRARRLAGLERLLDAPATFGGLSPQEVVQRTRRIAPAGTIATVDAGAHMLVAMPLWETEEPDEALISSGLATMGFALPAAIASGLAHSDRRTVCFVGDGGLGMVLAELETLARLQLPVTVVVFNDSVLSLIAVKQKPEGHGGPGAITYRNTDFSLIAHAHGVPGSRVETLQGLEQGLERSFARPGPSLLDVRVDPGDYGRVLDAIRGPER